jgi:hypothetical protein
MNITNRYSENKKCQKCPFGWVNRNNKCYLLNLYPLQTFTNYNSFCKDKKASILNMNAENEWNEINLLNNEYYHPSIWVLKFQASLNNYLLR